MAKLKLFVYYCVCVYYIYTAFQIIMQIAFKCQR